MSISKKIDQIRNKPEHIRLRYAWGMALAGTFLVIIVWIFSIAAQKDKDSSVILNSGQMQSIEDIKNQATSLKNSAQDLQKSIDSVAPQKAESQQNIDNKLNQETDQSNAASDQSPVPDSSSNLNSSNLNADLNTENTAPQDISGSTAPTDSTKTTEGFKNN